MHAKSILRTCLLLSLPVLLSACGAASDAPGSGTPALMITGSFVPSSMLSQGSDIPKLAWDSPARVDAQLRTLFLGYLDAVKTKDAAAMRERYLTAEAYGELLATCAAAVDIRETPWVCVRTTEAQPVITATKIEDETHATISVSFYDAKGQKAGEPLTVPALLTRDGPRLADGRLK